MITRIVRVSCRNLARQPLRTLLILQGVIWGTALGVAPPAIIRGSRATVEGKAQLLGTDRILITQESVGPEQQFDWPLIDRLRADLGSDIQHVAGLSVQDLDARAAAGRGRAVLIATDERAMASRAQRMAAGRFLSRRDLVERRAVAVVEPHGLDHEPRLGETLRVPRLAETPLEIVGITAARAEPGQMLDELGYERNHPLRDLLEHLEATLGVFSAPHAESLGAEQAIIVPHTLLPDARPNWIELRAEPRRVLAVRDRLQQFLRANGYEPVIYVNALLPVLYGQTIETVLELNRAVFIMAITVGTSVVCSIMILSVVERQREIAIRRVEGARGWHVALQFVVETGTLCGVGGVLGVPLGLAVAALRCWLEPHGAVTWVFPGPEVAVLLLVVTSVGLAGGLLPAWRAIRVDPVEILRYE
jgi:putative ABC transport system permease protein